MTRPRLRPLGLIGQIVAILLVAVVVEFAASTLLYERASEFSVRDDEARRLGEHLIVARQLMESAPRSTRREIAAELSTDHYQTGWSANPPARDDQDLALVRRQIIGWEPSLRQSDLRLKRIGQPIGTRIAGGLVLRDGSWLSFATKHQLAHPEWWRGRIAIAAMIAAVVVMSASMVARQTLKPLRRLARAADRFGRTGPERVVEDGPAEIRQVIAAFNRMGSRIERLIAERTEALAAVSHDLRTPLARLRLRSDHIADADLRATMSADIVEMEAMVTSLLSFLAGENNPEAPVLTDVAVLCATLADDAADQGRDVEFNGPNHCELLVRRGALKRAVSNLLENALHYGTSARVIVEPRTDTVVIAVEDDGPGIPEAALQSVLEPFVRLDKARRRDTVGLGLGLAIVSRVVATEGGRLLLSNRREGGLRAEISLPWRKPPVAQA
jgi:signal transduction histidine kinase